MASGCVNNIGLSPESFIDCPKFSSYGWLSPRISFSREFPDQEAPKSTGAAIKPSGNTVTCNEKREEADPGTSPEKFVDFEFRLEDPVTMLPADELISDGKLMPLQVSVIRPMKTSEPSTFEVKSPEKHKVRRRNEISSNDTNIFSPRAPTCSSRWKDILGLKKLQNKQDHDKTSSSGSSTNGNRYLKHFLLRNHKSSSVSSSLDLSVSLPLLKDAESDSASMSTSRLSHSSSSSGHDYDDLPRLSLDSERPNSARTGCQKTNGINPGRLRVAKARALSSENPGSMRAGRSHMRNAPETVMRGPSVDSPRMNSSGKIVFHSLERSSSSPSSLNGGACRYKHRGMERSYSANVRFTPVLNVPVCSLRGSSKSGGGVFGLFSSSQQKKEGCAASTVRNGAGNKGHNSGKNRADRSVSDFERHLKRPFFVLTAKFLGISTVGFVAL